MAALRDADSRELDVEAAFPKLVAARTLDDAEDLAALTGRMRSVYAVTCRSRSWPPPWRQARPSVATPKRS